MIALSCLLFSFVCLAHSRSYHDGHFNDGSQRDRFCDDKADGNYRDPDNCHGFIQCSNRNMFKQNCYSLPILPPLVYNEETDQCDWSSNVQCDQETCTFDFEAGILDWNKNGSAFNNQPTYGDNPSARGRGQPANQQGDWWIGTAEDRPSKSVTAGQMQGDAPTGTLTSPYFRIIGGHISFLIGGGCDIQTVRAELIVDNKAVRQTTGECGETMTRKEWNVQRYVGRRARVRLVDSSSAGWGHINFDDLKGDIRCF